MEAIMDSLNTAFKAISSIPVTGDSVDAMAVARAQLRKAYAEVERIKSEQTDAEKTDTQDE